MLFCRIPLINNRGSLQIHPQDSAIDSRMGSVGNKSAHLHSKQEGPHAQRSGVKASSYMLKVNVVCCRIGRASGAFELVLFMLNVNLGDLGLASMVSRKRVTIIDDSKVKERETGRAPTPLLFQR